MKKAISILLLLLLAGMLAVPAMAAEVTQITITSSAAEAKPGDEITFTVTIDGGESCRYYGLILEYDASVYEMQNGECTVKGAMFSAFDPERGFVVLNNKERVPEGTVGTFTMKVREGAVSGNAAVTGVSSVKTGDEAKESAVTGANVKINGVASSTVETTVPKQTEPAGTQNQTTTKPTTPTKPTKPAETTPAATKPAETKPVEETQAAAATEAPVQTESVTAAETVEAAAVETTQVQVMEEPEQQEEKESLLLPAIAFGAAIACAVLLMVVLIKKRKK